MPFRDIFYKENYYHVYSRGNEKRDIFRDQFDYLRLLKRLKEYRQQLGITLICYCLMPNHYHLLLRQDTDKSVSSLIHRLQVSYAMYFNKKYERVGHLFQGRFKAKLIDKDDYLLQVSSYIHRNPMEIKKDFKNYPWSSYLEYLGETHWENVDKEVILSYFTEKFPGHSYQNFVEEQVIDFFDEFMD